MSTFNKILLGLLAIQLLLIVLMRIGGDHTSINPQAPLLPEFDSEAVTRLEIKAPRTDDKPAIALDQRGDAWLLSSHFDYPADATAVKTLLGKIAGMQSRGPTTVSEAAHKQLEVGADNYQRKLVLTGGEVTTLFLGSSPKFRKLTVRVDGAVETHSVANLSIGDVPVDMSDWVDPVYVDIPERTIAAITIETPATNLTLERSEGRWRLVGATTPDAPSLDQEAVGKLVTAAAKIELEEVVGGEAEERFGFASPQARITIGIDSGAANSPGPSGDGDAGAAPSTPEREIHLIEIGASSADRYYVRELGNSHIVSVEKTALSPLVEATVAALTDADATPAPPAPLP